MNKLTDLFNFAIIAISIVAIITLGVLIAYISLPVVLVTLFFVVCYILIVDKLRKDSNE